ncbi:MAG: hypothetical protein EOM51_00705 [Clostridia bacterium]|nr:hypothetical protein [Clostridia bacterium]
MSTNEIIPANNKISDELTEADKQIIQSKLWLLLKRRTELYTMGDSSSVRIETAQELMRSIEFCIGLYLKHSGSSRKLLAESELEELFSLGQKLIEEQLELGKKLYSKACLTAPEIENLSYQDTLRSIGGFFKHYDYRFFAHLIPCDIDYQLCNPVRESMLGIEYLNDYLGRIIIENDFVRKFNKESAESLLKAYCSDYKGLLINLYSPLAANSVGLALLDEDVKALNITAEDGDHLSSLFGTLSATPAKKALHEAALHVCSELNISDPSSVRYLLKTAEALLPRISAALPHGNLGGIFITF